jgi:hypothetical protein
MQAADGANTTALSDSHALIDDRRTRALFGTRLVGIQTLVVARVDSSHGAHEVHVGQRP